MRVGQLVAFEGIVPRVEGDYDQPRLEAKRLGEYLQVLDRPPAGNRHAVDIDVLLLQRETEPTRPVVRQPDVRPCPGGPLGQLTDDRPGSRDPLNQDLTRLAVARPHAVCSFVLMIKLPVCWIL